MNCGDEAIEAHVAVRNARRDRARFCRFVRDSILHLPILRLAVVDVAERRIIGVFTIASLIRGYCWRRICEAMHVSRPLSPFMRAAIAERFRQIEHEGFSPEDDDRYVDGELRLTAGCYLLHAGTLATSAARLALAGGDGGSLTAIAATWCAASRSRSRRASGSIVSVTGATAPAGMRTAAPDVDAASLGREAIVSRHKSETNATAAEWSRRSLVTNLRGGLELHWKEFWRDLERVDESRRNAALRRASGNGEKAACTTRVQHLPDVATNLGLSQRPSLARWSSMRPAT